MVAGMWRVVDGQSMLPGCKRDWRRDEMVIKHLDRVVQRRVRDSRLLQ
jgi:hypothetical protein